jgi:transcriptional regulator with XRE-family HTH domain
MNGQTAGNNLPLTIKIARLVIARGWNQEDFARIANLNRQTVAQIMEEEKQNLQEGHRKLRNTTVSACARALGLPVMDLRTLPLERLLARMNGQGAAGSDENLRRLYEAATQPELLAWIERNPERARQLTPAEIDELLSLQGTGGPLTTIGVEHFVDHIERKRRLIDKIHAIAGTEYLDLLEKLVALMYDKVQPYGNRQ